jgi:hypothetical protein
MGPPLYMRSFVDQNIMWHMTALEVKPNPVQLCKPQIPHSLRMNLDLCSRWQATNHPTQGMTCFYQSLQVNLLWLLNIFPISKWLHNVSNANNLQEHTAACHVRRGNFKLPAIASQD